MRRAAPRVILIQAGLCSLVHVEDTQVADSDATIVETHLFPIHRLHSSPDGIRNNENHEKRDFMYVHYYSRFLKFVRAKVRYPERASNKK